MNHTTFNSVSVGVLCHHRAKGGLQDFANFLFSDFQILFLFFFAGTDDVADSSGLYRKKKRKRNTTFFIYNAASLANVGKLKKICNVVWHYLALTIGDLLVCDPSFRYALATCGYLDCKTSHLN